MKGGGEIPLNPMKTAHYPFNLFVTQFVAFVFMNLLDIFETLAQEHVRTFN